MSRLFKSILFTVLLGFFTVVSAQLPPEVMLDKYLVLAEQLHAAKNYAKAFSVMKDSISALVAKEDSLKLPEEYHFKYARVALSADSIRIAIDEVNRYLSSPGKESEFYKEALALLVEAEQHEIRTLYGIFIAFIDSLKVPGSYILPFLTFLLVLSAVRGKTWVGNKRDPNKQGHIFIRAWRWIKWVWNNVTIWGKLTVFFAAISFGVSVLGEIETKDKAREVDVILNSTLNTAKNVKGTIDNVEANLPSHFNQIAGKVDNVQDSVGQVKGEVNNVQDSVEVVKGEVKAVQSSVGQVKGEVNNVQDSVEVVKGEVKAVQSNVGQVKGEVKAVQSSVGQVKGEVNNVQDSVEVVKGEVKGGIFKSCG